MQARVDLGEKAAGGERRDVAVQVGVEGEGREDLVGVEGECAKGKRAG